MEKRLDLPEVNQIRLPRAEDSLLPQAGKLGGRIGGSRPVVAVLHKGVGGAAALAARRSPAEESGRRQEPVFSALRMGQRRDSELCRSLRRLPAGVGKGGPPHQFLRQRLIRLCGRRRLLFKKRKLRLLRRTGLPLPSGKAGRKPRLPR